MNTQALQQLLDTGTQMFDHALNTFKEMRELDALQAAEESEEEQKRKRRLKALRWALIMGAAYGGYRLIRRILRRKRQIGMYPANQSPTRAIQPLYNGYQHHSSYGAAASPYAPSAYGGAASPYYGGGSSMYPPPTGYGGPYY